MNLDFYRYSQVLNGTAPFENISGPTPTIIIGRGSKGPSLLPIEGISRTQVENVFGPESELAEGYFEASKNGAANIYLIRYNGLERAATIVNNDDEVLITLKTIDNSDGINKYMSKTDIEDGEEYLQIYNEDNGYNFKINIDTIKTLELVNKINEFNQLSISDFYATLEKNTAANSIKMQDSIKFEYETYMSSYNLSIKDSYDRIEFILNQISNMDIFQVGFTSLPTYLSTPTKEKTYYQIFSEFSSSRLKSSKPCFISFPVAEARGSSSQISDVMDYFLGLFDEKDTLYYNEPSIFINPVLAHYDSPMLSGASNGVCAYCGIIKRTYDGNKSTSGEKIDYGRDLLKEKIPILSDYIKDGITVISGDSIPKVLKGTNMMSKFLSKGKYPSIKRNSDGEITNTMNSCSSSLIDLNNVFKILRVLNNLNLDDMTDSPRGEIVNILERAKKDYKIDYSINTDYNNIQIDLIIFCENSIDAIGINLNV